MEKGQAYNMKDLAAISNRLYTVLKTHLYEPSFIQGQSYCICCRRDRAETEADHRGCIADTVLSEYEDHIRTHPDARD